jgi:hypothetical protein
MKKLPLLLMLIVATATIQAQDGVLPQIDPRMPKEADFGCFTNVSEAIAKFEEERKFDLEGFSRILPVNILKTGKTAFEYTVKWYKPGPPKQNDRGYWLYMRSEKCSRRTPTYRFFVSEHFPVLLAPSGAGSPGVIATK